MAITDEGLILVPGLMSRWVRLQSGAKAHYVTAGESGPNVVLFHGAVAGSGGTAGWRFMAPVLAQAGFRVFCPDLPAFGINEGVNEAYFPGPAGTVDFVHDFVSALCLDTFHIGGNSQGCSTAMNYTINHPDKILSFAGIATAANMHGVIDEEARQHADTRPADARNSYPPFDGSEESMRRAMNMLVYRKEALDDELVTMRTLAARRNVEALKARQQAQAHPDRNTEARLNLKDRFAALDIPAIYLCGLQDVTATPEIFHLQEDALPNVQVFYLDECGHQAQTDQPEIVNQVFLEFFRDGKVSRKTAERAGVSTRRPTLPVVESN